MSMELLGLIYLTLRRLLRTKLKLRISKLIVTIIIMIKRLTIIAITTNNQLKTLQMSRENRKTLTMLKQTKNLKIKTIK